MNPRGPPGTPMDIETFPSNISNKIHGANPFTILNISLENTAEAKCKIFFFLSFSNTWIFQKIGQSFLCFSDFPKFTKPAKTFKNTSNLSILNNPRLLNFRFRTSRPQPNQHNIHTYTFVYFKSSKHSNPLKFHAHFYQNILGLSRT